MTKLEYLDGQFFFNLDADVGKMSPNRIEDVELVRFGYFCKKSNPRALLLMSAREKVSVLALQPRGPYRSDLQEAIDAHQENRGGTQDGKVSVGKPQLSHGERYDRAHVWIIFTLCYNLAAVLPNIYPRIDLHDQSGPEISKRVRELFGVVY